MKKRYHTAIATVMALAAMPAAASTFSDNAVAMSLSNGGKTLVTIAGVGAGRTVTLRENGRKISVNDIDYRPKTGELFGYSDATDTVYLIDPVTGASKAMATLAGSTKSANAGFDFNNVIDAARAVSDADDNTVFFPTRLPPVLETKTALFYGATDINAGVNPNVSMNAYTNAVANATTTLQYVIDSGLDVLATLANNDGTLATVGKLYLDGVAFDAGVMGGFDILSFAEGNNQALALFTSGSRALKGIYSFDLFADLDGRINLVKVAGIDPTFGRLDGFAVTPAPIPLPATALLLAGALGLGGAVSRRRRRV